ncbi:MAG: exodeoxyribonuclease VII small subunit [Planctomycetota bacterium]|jgi:exodeoxyribonuclease VII small subunit
MSAKKSKAESEDADLSFEEGLEQIQQIVERIESGEVGLEASLDEYARGMKLIAGCRKVLDRAETRIKKLAVDEEGNLVESGDAPTLKGDDA